MKNIDLEDVMETIPNKKKYVLTTTDNPYSVEKEFNKWYNYDEEHGYNTCGLLSRTIDALKEFKPNLSDSEVEEEAINSIIRLNLSGKHKKVLAL